METAKGTVVSVNTSSEKGVPKVPQDKISLLEEHGVEGDAHASSTWHRQVSLLSMASIERMREQGVKVAPGDLAENITIEGIDVHNLPIGTRLRVGRDVLLEISQIGKECHTGCAIQKRTGKCIMPTEGVFARVIAGGTARAGDTVTLA
ncbi:MAG: MOSC domain-containing protein [Candidatus Undinarchaeales archaeon]|jgi:MOSC domain-containing protein YiiM|nr:MOSC domain-containing protein [Candidatus Undinarchaeales archaeon]MDP7493497.1 MOSC domain-containing protein [Candidatus Undinarchaeales archaeon]